MFAENNRISWLQMHCQCLLAALGVGLVWGIPEFTGREGAVGILNRWHTSRPVERDPSKADDSIPGSDPVSGKSSRLADSWNLGELSGAYRWMAGGKSRASGRRISGFRSAGDITFPYFCSCGTGSDPIMYRHGGGWRKSHGRLQHGWEGSCCCWLQFKTVLLWRWCGAINIWKQQGLTGNGV